MRSLAFWSTTPLSQAMSPTSLTTTTSQRPLKFSSRSPPATPGPRTCITQRSVTTPSAERSLHHCSRRSEKNQLAVDKLITLLKKVWCQVNLVRQVQASEKIHVVTEKMSKSGFFWNDKKSKFSLIVGQRFGNTNSKPL